MFPGPPDTPAGLVFPADHVNMELGQFSAVWNVPFSHSNHSISHYNVTVNSYNFTRQLEESFPVNSGAHPLPTSGKVEVILRFPPRTFSCDIINVSVTAVNDIGPSQPASAVMFLPKGECTTGYNASVNCTHPIELHSARWRSDCYN